jgi:hypothetical protein
MRFGELWRSGHLLDRRRREIGFLIGLSAVLELAAGVGLAYVAGFAAVQHVLGGMLEHWPWLLALAGSLVVSFAGYYFAYDGIFNLEHGPLEHGPRLTARQMRVVVTAGFGGFLSHGGAGLDTHALTSAGCQKREASVRVWGLSGLEQGVLSLAACVAAIVLLVAGRNVPPLNFTLPWAVIPVPGFLLAFWLAERYRGRLCHRLGAAGKLGIFLDSIHLVRRLFLAPGRRHAGAVPGMALFWAADFFAAWCALAAFDLRMSVAGFIVGVATGMIFTRRAAPLAGAGILALVLPVTLWVSGAPLAIAISGIFVYRILSLWLPLPFALASLPELRQLGGRTVGRLAPDGGSTADGQRAAGAGSPANAGSPAAGARTADAGSAVDGERAAGAGSPANAGNPAGGGLAPDGASTVDGERAADASSPGSGRRTAAKPVAATGRP